ncbi:hypothetical protein L596_029084 [Steinernema carpocapsae]|uniref:Uncharacterized protein n=1 Tax=Steinernema carpocapsae TaxID=34508 RepID=A0A4U5LTL5_STECR|nr:hypothetical protein L596_029084 [Steinernema carpocapsae]
MLSEIHCSLFTDDLKIYAFSNPRALKTALMALETWSTECGLPISESKTLVMHVGWNNPKIECVKQFCDYQDRVGQGSGNDL